MKETDDSSTMIYVSVGEEFAFDHIPSAIHIPYDRVAVRVNKFIAMKN